MKFLFFITFLIISVSCRPAQKPAQQITTVPLTTINSFVTDSVAAANVDANAGNAPMDDESKIDVVNKIENHGIIYETLRYPNSSDGRLQRVRMTFPDRTSQTIDMSSNSAEVPNLIDWDKDGYLDRVVSSGKYGYYNVELYDPKTKQFNPIDYTFREDEWDFDASKGLKIEHTDNNTYRHSYVSNFENIYNLYEYKNGFVKIVSTITFLIDSKNGESNCAINIQNGQSKTVPIEGSFFESLRKKAEKMDAIRTKANQESEGSNEEGFSEAHKMWVKEAKPLVEKYWRQKQ